MKIAATVAISNFPFWKMCLSKLVNQVDAVFVRRNEDDRSQNKIEVPSEEEIREVFGDKLKGMMTTNEGWSRWKWREDLIRMMDDYKPDLVLQVDQDEVFEDTIRQELNEFYASGLDLFFSFCKAPMPSDDGRLILQGNPYPSLAHCQAYRWKPGLTFHPYVGLKIPTQYAKSQRYEARTKYLHYCMYTKELELEKMEWVKKEYGMF